MRLVIVTASLAVLALGAWAAEAATSTPPKCSALDTQRHATLSGGGYDRYCGPGRAVVRVGSRSYTIESGNCSGAANRRSFGLVGSGGQSGGKGFWFRLEPVKAATGRTRWFVRPGRVNIMDGDVDVPGWDSFPRPGTAIISKDVKSATFSLGSPPRITGSWRCR
jgi:hypothetical protein